jgi:AcrR family transcriptional regulator
MARDSAALAVEHAEQRERIVGAAGRLAVEHGLGDLTVRRIAEAAGTTTMAVYSRFGGRGGVLEALYRRAFEMLGEGLGAVAPRQDAEPRSRLLDLALAYREFALSGPSRYSFMFDRPLPDFEPGQALRAEAFEGSLGPLIDAVRAAGKNPATAVREAYCLWSVLHGLVGLELADVLGTPLPGWGIVPTDGAAERMYRAGVEAMIVGLELG